MILDVDITNFMTWFLNQIISIFSQAFNILDSIKFLGTSLLQVIIAINVIAIILKVFLSIQPNLNKIAPEGKKKK